MSTTTEPLWPQPIPIIGVTGDYASGKTLFGLTIAPGPQTRVYDTEKSSKTYESLGFDRVDVPEELLKKHPRGYRPIDAFTWWRDHVRAVKPGQFRAIVLDTASEIEEGLADYVEAHPGEFGRTSAQYAKMSGLKWGDVKAHWKLLLSELAARCETFCFAVHLKPVWAGNTPTARKTPKGKSTLEELASLYLWLERKPDAKGDMPARPAAVVRKSRLFCTRTDGTELEITPALPPRLEVATPAAVRQYLLAPPDYAKLKPGERAPEEKVTEEEMAELRARAAEAEAETERLRLERMEREDRREERRKATPAQPAAPEAPRAAPPPAAQTVTKAPAVPAAAPKKGAPGEGTLNRLKELRDRLFRATEETDQKGKWLQILGKRNVSTALDLTEEQAGELADNLEKRLNSVLAAQEKEVGGRATVNGRPF